MINQEQLTSGEQRLTEQNKFMESIVISQAKLSAQVFYAFSSSRFVRDRLIQPGVGPNSFFWTMYPVGYYESDKGKTPTNEEKIVFEISRDDLPFRASIGDMSQYLSTKWSEFESIVKSRV